MNKILAFGLTLALFSSISLAAAPTEEQVTSFFKAEIANLDTFKEKIVGEDFKMKIKIKDGEFKLKFQEKGSQSVTLKASFEDFSITARGTIVTVDLTPTGCCSGNGYMTFDVGSGGSAFVFSPTQIVAFEVPELIM